MTNQTLARLAGALYLLLAVLGGWAELAARGTVRVPGDAAATVANIARHETLFRLGLVADLLMATVFVALGLVLHRLFLSLHRAAATTLLVLVAAGATAILTNLTFHAGALALATEPGFGTGRDGLVLTLLRLHEDGYVLGGVFFGLWLLPIAWVTRRTGVLPAFFGPLLVVAAAAWVLDPVLRFALPDADLLRGLVALPTVAGEFGLLGYLLVRGVRPVTDARAVRGAG